MEPLPKTGPAPIPPAAPPPAKRSVTPAMDLGTLSPLQRQRLETAVMLLVNYLVSASTGGQDML